MANAGRNGPAADQEGPSDARSSKTTGRPGAGNPADHARLAFAAVFLWDPERRCTGDGGRLDVAPGIVRDPNGKERVVDAMAIPVDQPTELTERITHGTSRPTPRLRVEFTGERITLEPLDGEQWRLTSLDGHRERRIGGQPMDLAIRGACASWLVHAGPDDRLHRVIRFDLRQGVA